MFSVRQKGEIADKNQIINKELNKERITRALMENFTLPPQLLNEIVEVVWNSDD